ncbi:MAG: hypothetical protein A2275_08185 [Bacteroidetes bacterium RIFOXYA12_FULL_35_11]|nr:MAG: hypothetical protein A2275_08185 [Bacteroidetes bacterium RIFOXYA12_FULL_35_11]OFY93334.1 MAG: hypothetical protein A2491_03725 [Bacteroidetes bacterium RIFOXYC12_FULL_35_7]OFY94524.1 MAG: hypothetical protein A2309_02305 [Bacteroidetes bacterium RIFOXYB2_FULL_35_7]
MKLSNCRTIIIILTVLTLNLRFETLNCFAQDIHFSQYYANPLNINPASAGSFNENARILLTYKDQWGQLENPYKTYAFSADAGFLRNKLKTGYLGGGINLLHDIAGITKLSTTVINLSVSYHVKLSRLNMLTAGIQGGIIQNNINSTDMQWDNQYDGNGFNPALASGENINYDGFLLGDASIGLLWKYQSEKVKILISNEGIKTEIGVAAFHVNKPEYSFFNASKDNLYTRFVAHGKASVEISNTNFAVVPTFTFMRQSVSGELILGSYFRFMVKDNSANKGFLYSTALSVGTHYRWGDAWIFSVLFESKHWALGLSYDMNTSSLKYATNKDGGIEVTLRFTTPNPFEYRNRGNSLL